MQGFVMVSAPKGKFYNGDTTSSTLEACTLSAHTVLGEALRLYMSQMMPEVCLDAFQLARLLQRDDTKQLRHLLEAMELTSPAPVHTMDVVVFQSADLDRFGEKLHPLHHHYRKADEDDVSRTLASSPHANKARVHYSSEKCGVKRYFLQQELLDTEMNYSNKLRSLLRYKAKLLEWSGVSAYQVKQLFKDVDVLLDESVQFTTRMIQGTTSISQLLHDYVYPWLYTKLCSWSARMSFTSCTLPTLSTSSNPILSCVTPTGLLLT
jgi:hypothetical protein